MQNVVLKNLTGEQEDELRKAFKNITKDKIIIYVEDEPAIGGPTRQLIRILADPSAEIIWLDKAENAMDKINEIRNNDPSKLRNVVVITDDDTESRINGRALIRFIHNDENLSVKNIPTVLFTGYTRPAEGIKSDVVTVLDDHTAATAKPFNIHVIAKAVEMLEKNRDMPLSQQKKADLYTRKTDQELIDTIKEGEAHYATLRSIQKHHDATGSHLARSDREYWREHLEAGKFPPKSDTLIWKEQMEETLEAIGYARKEIERRKDRETEEYYKG